MLVNLLDSDGYRSVQAATGAEAAQLLRERSPDLVLLDVMLYDEDGFDVLASMRRTSDVPVILLTGKVEENDRVLGLRLGADDYVMKPFSGPELLARVSSVLRRYSQPKAAHTTLDFGELLIDMRSREVRLGGVEVETTAKEFDLLAFLASSPRQVFTRDQLLDRVWGSSSDWQDAGTVTEHVRRIRRKLADGRNGEGWIHTVRGVGYRFEPTGGGSAG